MGCGTQQHTPEEIQAEEGLGELHEVQKTRMPSVFFWSTTNNRSSLGDVAFFFFRPLLLGHSGLDGLGDISSYDLLVSISVCLKQHVSVE
jgi:hypothetical protein